MLVFHTTNIKKDNMKNINILIKKYNKLNENYKYLIYEANKINLIIDKELELLNNIINKINNIILNNYEKKINYQTEEDFNKLLILLNNVYNILYKKILCYE